MTSPTTAATACAPVTGLSALPADQLMSVLAHDLRSPLSAVLGFLELALDNPAYPLRPEQSLYIELAQRAARPTLCISDDLLTASALGRGASLDRDDV